MPFVFSPSHDITMIHEFGLPSERTKYCMCMCLYWAPSCGRSEFKDIDECEQIERHGSSLHRGHLKTFNKSKLNTNMEQISCSTKSLLTRDLLSTECSRENNK